MAVSVGSVVPRYVRAVTLDPGAIPAATINQQTFTVVGLETDMVLSVSAPSLEADAAVLSAHVSAKNTLALRFYSVAGVNPASQVFNIVAH